jgi:hypothetical protein
MTFEHPSADDAEAPAEHRPTCDKATVSIPHSCDAYWPLVVCEDPSGDGLDSWVSPANTCSECSLPLTCYSHKTCCD